MSPKSPETAVDAGAIPQRQFSTARRGLDPGEVRAYLEELAAVVADLQQREQGAMERAVAAEQRAEQAENPDQHQLVEMLGEETARVLDAARAAARDIREKAEASAERLISEASEQAHERRAEGEAEVLSLRREMLAEVEELRREAEAELERRRAEGDELVAEMRREAQVSAEGLRQEGERQRAEVMAEADSLREAAREEARRLVAEAETMRRRVLGDLARRRRAAREQLERLNGARGRLLAAYAVVRRTVDEATAELNTSLPEAKLASDAALRRVRQEPETTAEEMESQVSLARVTGLLPALPENPQLDEVLDPPQTGEDGHGATVVEGAVVETVEAEIGAAEVGTAGPVDPPPGDDGARTATTGGSDPGQPEVVPPDAVPTDPDVGPAMDGGTSDTALAAVEQLAAWSVDDGDGDSDGSEDGRRPDAATPDGVGGAGPVPASLWDPEELDFAPAFESHAGDPGEDPDGVADAAAPPAPAALLATQGEFSLGNGVAPGQVGPGDDLAGSGAGPGSDESEGSEGSEGEAPGDVPDDADEGASTIDALFARLKGGAVPATPPDDVLIRQRDETLEPLERTLSRRLKRVLADEQNEMLDLVRRGVSVGDGLLPETLPHCTRYSHAATDELSTAAYWGAAAAGGAPGGSCDNLVDELGRSLVEPLRDRLLRSVEEADGDGGDLTERLRALYREWKNHRVGEAVRHFVAAAYACGAYDAVPDGSALRWVVDHTGGPCPDAEDNALAGEVRKGEAFPTGHCAPPAHPGCRCLIMPATAEPVGGTMAGSRPESGSA